MLAAAAAGVAAVGITGAASLALCEKTTAAAAAAAPSFDPEALERGAKALREINKSANAKQVRKMIGEDRKTTTARTATTKKTVGGSASSSFPPTLKNLFPSSLLPLNSIKRQNQPPPPPKQVIELARQQEVTKAQELKTKQAELEAYAKQQSVEQERVRWEEQRKTMQQDAQAKAQLAQYQDELARKRNASEHEAARARNAELVALQEEGVKRQEQERARAAAAIEAERRATEKYKSDLESRVQQARALAEAEGRIKEGRANEDVNRRAALLALEEGRKKALAEINAVFSNLGSAASALLSDRAKLSAAVAGLSALALGVYGAREGTRVAARALDRWLGTPSLVRETSRAGLWRKGSSTTTTTAAAASNAKRDFSDIVLPGVLSDRVRGLAAATASTKRHNAPFRHMLFYGESFRFFTLVFSLSF